MSTVKITRESYRHDEGAKDYHFVRITNLETGESVVLFRYGKKDLPGKCSIRWFSTERLAALAYGKKLSEKTGRGYTQKIMTLGSGADTIFLPLKDVSFGYEDLSQFLRPVELEALKAEAPSFLERLASAVASKDEPPAPVRPVVPARPTHDYRADPEWGLF